MNKQKNRSLPLLVFLFGLITLAPSANAVSGKMDADEPIYVPDRNGSTMVIDAKTSSPTVWMSGLDPTLSFVTYHVTYKHTEGDKMKLKKLKLVEKGHRPTGYDGHHP